MRNWKDIAALLLGVSAVLIANLALAASGHGGEHGGHHAVNWVYVICLFANLIGFIIIMFVLLKKPVAQFFAERSLEVSEKLAAADRAREKAEQTIKEYEMKIDELTSTRLEVIEKSKKEAAYEKERIIDSANRQAKQILADAERSVKIEFDKAQRKLSTETAGKIAKLAEEMLVKSVTEQDNVRLAEEYIAKLEEESRA